MKRTSADIRIYVNRTLGQNYIDKIYSWNNWQHGQGRWKKYFVAQLGYWLVQQLFKAITQKIFWGIQSLHLTSWVLVHKYNINLDRFTYLYIVFSWFNRIFRQCNSRHGGACLTQIFASTVLFNCFLFSFWGELYSGWYSYRHVVFRDVSRNVQLIRWHDLIEVLDSW